jgi:uncharacterized protein YbjT (DUF2867 family)
MSQTTGGKSILVAGATGLVGRECVDLLIADPLFTRIVALVRRPLAKEIKSERIKVEQIDFDRLEERPEIFGVDVVLCALGTTLRQAGSRSAFRTVDHDYPMKVAKICLERGARHFLLVSALGADPGSRVFYSRVKGELEHDIGELGYPSLTIVRPSFLIGERQEPRFGEGVARRCAFLFPARFRPVAATIVAASLVRAASDVTPGTHIIENRNILT